MFLGSWDVSKEGISLWFLREIKKVIEAYISNQIQTDKIHEPLNLKEYMDQFTGDPRGKVKKYVANKPFKVQLEQSAINSYVKSNHHFCRCTWLSTSFSETVILLNIKTLWDAKTFLDIE